MGLFKKDPPEVAEAKARQREAREAAEKAARSWAQTPDGKITAAFRAAETSAFYNEITAQYLRVIALDVMDRRGLLK